MENENNKISYQDQFRIERGEWKEKIGELAGKLKSIRTVAEAQVDLFTQRQILLEYGYKLAGLVSKLNSKIRVENNRLLRQYSENNDVRYQANEKKILIEGDLATTTEKLENIESHRKFIDQTIQTIDHMLYSIKSRISLEEYIRNSSGAIK